MLKNKFSKKKICLNHKSLILFILIIILGISLKLYFSISNTPRQSLSIDSNNSSNSIKELLSATQIIIPTPTIFYCQEINEVSQDEIEQQKAEDNLLTITRVKELSDIKVITKIEYLEKQLIQCETIDNQYCQLTNKDNRYAWTIKYPKQWQLYRIKSKVTNNISDQQYIFYDLKFEYQSSFFYLKESLTLGGNPMIIMKQQWNILKNSCTNSFYTSNNKIEHYFCSGGITNCIYLNRLINKYYQSYIVINNTLKDETDIYPLYIKSLDFDRDQYVGALRIYTFNSDFFSNDDWFISELKAMLINITIK